MGNGLVVIQMMGEDMDGQQELSKTTKQELTFVDEFRRLQVEN
jgi:hypothetical protein